METTFHTKTTKVRPKETTIQTMSVARGTLAALLTMKVRATMKIQKVATGAKMNTAAHRPPGVVGGA